MFEKKSDRFSEALESILQGFKGGGITIGVKVFSCEKA
jgi:hypothetical protein